MSGRKHRFRLAVVVLAAVLLGWTLGADSGLWVSFGAGVVLGFALYAPLFDVTVEVRR